MTGFFAGLFVAAVLSVAITVTLQLGSAASFLVGLLLSVVCTAVGMVLSA